MQIAANSIVLGLIVWIVVVGGAIVLQIFLSRKENKWLGLILPGITFLWSLSAVFGFMIFVGAFGLTGVLSTLFTCFVMNIPTFVLLAIYAACRQGKKWVSDVDKMNIQDL